MYNTKLLTIEDYDFFYNIYEDFYKNAKSEYNFDKGNLQSIN